MLITILAVIGGLFVAWWILAFIIGNLANKTSIGIKNVRYLLKKNGIDPDSLTPRQVESIANNAILGAQIAKSGRFKFDSNEFQRQLAFLTLLVSRRLKGQPQDPNATDLAKMLLGEKTDL
ncbi:hypothetical protein [Mesorhizobium sp. M2C.T.Ca.TU.002.02.1.1]|jgi:hypothetical protein|uniref:hypothetical protein n=1 Tax=Mesorhizobium sp. M2C.T.Ca.TU.002.02.1.1 TaxID=2496788 RepID=UPI000FCAEEE4|nr:hypothetical protein [Mesorhizobium sp. M2C.T.Ca.TU.002.02.1.1]RUU57580.1 hypothetical protein EOD07_12500 [Mesorhizobium sp. M2C.T.Ca.TU.002.02.1.1]